MQAFWINSNFSFLKRFYVCCNYIFVYRYDVLSFVIVNQVKYLQGRNDIFFFYAGHLADFTVNKMEHNALSKKLIVIRFRT